jgi:protein-S-isoprenylcysteine O-methyltransferase Ste14
MPPKPLTKDLYADHSTTRVQRLALTASLALALAVAWWLLLGGAVTAGLWFHLHWTPGDPTRRLALAIALSIYFVRLLFTQFVFLRRALGWSEASTIAVWVFILCLWLSLAAASNPTSLGVAAAAGFALFLLGSWMNSWSEYTRHRWKQRPENRGRLYTLGLFRLTRHPNYLGDVLSFSGLCLIAGRWFAAPIPILMLAGFVFVNIPMLDAHLHDHYGAAFDDYAARTARLIPFLY